MNTSTYNFSYTERPPSKDSNVALDHLQFFLIPIITEDKGNVTPINTSQNKTKIKAFHLLAAILLPYDINPPLTDIKSIL